MTGAIGRRWFGTQKTPAALEPLALGLPLERTTRGASFHATKIAMLKRPAIQRQARMPYMHQVTPFLRVRNINQAVSFFCETLGFELGFRSGEYAFVRRDNVAFRVIEDEPMPARGNGRYMSYVDVGDVDGLYAELKPKLDLLPPGSVCPPTDQSYGQREFTVVGPDGDLIAFGAPI